MFNIKKHSLLILMAMLILLMIPMSFATDSQDANMTIEDRDMSMDEMGICDFDNVEDTLLVDDSDKLSQDYDYEIIPNETEINYELGSTYGVNLSHPKYEPMAYMTLIYVYINGDDTPITIKTPGGFDVYVGSHYSVVDIGSFSQYLHEGTNTVVFHPTEDILAANNFVNNNFVPITIIASEPEPPTTVYYVDSSIGEDGNGSEGSVYTTIAAAVDAANTYFGDEGGSIIIRKGINGVYNESSTILISKNMLISADEGVDVTVTSSTGASIFSQTSKADVTLSGLTFKDIIIDYGAIYYQNGNDVDGSTLIIQNCSFINNEVPTLVRLVKTKATFKNDNFIENRVFDTGFGRGGLINYYDTGTSMYQLNKYVFDVSYCNIIGNVYDNEYVFTSPSFQTLVANNNYWGSNYETRPVNVYNKESNADYLTLTNWVVLNTTVSDEVSVGESTAITLAFKQNDGSTLGDYMPDLEVSLSAYGSITPSNITISSNVAETTYFAQKTGIDTITVRHDASILDSHSVICGGLDYAYVSTPTVNGSNRVEYLINTHGNIVIDIDCAVLDKFESYDKLFAWIGGVSKHINLMANENPAVLDLKYLSDEFRFEEGRTYTVYFHPNIDVLEDAGISEGEYKFNPLVIETVGTYYPEPTVVYNSTPKVGDKTSIDYELGDDTIVTVNVVYNDSYSTNDGFKDRNMRMFINGDTIGTVISGVNANAKSFTVNLADYITEEGDYSITFSPGESVLSWVFYGVDNHIIKLNNLTVKAVNSSAHIYSISPNPASVTDYSNESHIITLTASYTSNDFVQNQLSARLMYIYINGKQIGALGNVKANETSFTFDLADYIDYLVERKVNNISVHPDLLGLDSAFNNNNHRLYDIANLTVTLKRIYEIKYISTPVPGEVNYTKGSSENITVNVVNKADKFFDPWGDGWTVLAYIEGVSSGIDLEVDANSGSFTFDLNVLDDYLEPDNVYNIIFRPPKSAFDMYDAPEFEGSVFNNLTVTVYPALGPVVETTNYTTTPVPDVANYTVGDSLEITVNVDYDSTFGEALGELPIYVYINGGEGIDTGEKANATSFKFNLNSISSKLPVGISNITFGINANELVNVTTFNNLTLTVKDKKYEYIVTPNPSVVSYTKGESLNVTYTVEYDNLNLKNSKFQVFFDGSFFYKEELDDIDTNAKTFTIDLKDFDDYFRDGENHTIIIRHSYNVLFDNNDLGVMDCKFNVLTVNVTGTFVPEIKYETTPNETSIEYVKGSSKLISVITDCDNLDDAFSDCELYAYINGSDEEISLDGIMADTTPVIIDLKLLDEYLEEGKTYNIVFHPHTYLFGVMWAPSLDNARFNPLTITVKASEPIEGTTNYTTTPSVSSIDYTIGDSNVISISTDFASEYSDVLSELPVYVFINDGKGIEIAGIKANNNFELDLKVISDYLTVGKNVISFGPIRENLTKAIENVSVNYNVLTVNAENAPVDLDLATYVSIPTPSVVYYTLGESSNITVSTFFDKYFKNDLEFYSMFVYINGEEIEDRVKIDGIKANETNFTFDLKTISDKLVEGQNNLTFHPHTGALEGTFVGPYIFNKLTVIVGSTSEPIEPVKSVYNGIIYVDVNGNDNNNGSEDSPVSTIAKAIELSSSEYNTEHKIIVSKGTYTENDLNITSPIEIVGEDGAVIDAQGLGRILNINANVVNISGITFINGKSDKGGAINIQSGNVSISGCEFINNTASDGASIYSEANSLIVEENTFDSNKADKGAGVYISKGKNIVKNNKFTNNRGSEGAAIYTDSAYLDLHGNSMANNEGNGDIYSSNANINADLTLTFTAPEQAYVGNPIIITASLVDDKDNSISGFEVTFTSNGIEIGKSILENGTAAIEFTPQEETDYTISGSSDGNPTVVNTTISPILNTTIEISNITGVAGNEVVVPVSVKVNGENINGNVSVTFNGKTFDVKVVNGTANVSVKLPDKAGSYDLTVSYKGKEQSNAVIVDSKVFIVITINEISGNSITGMLGDIDGNPIANAEVKYIINNSNASLKTKADGTFSIEAEFDSEVLIYYDGDNNTLPFNTSITLKDSTPKRVASVINAEDYTTYAIDFYTGERGNYFKVQLVDIYGNVLANKPVKIGFNGVVYDRTTDDSGWAKLQINLQNAGTYTFAVGFLGDDNYTGSFVVQKITVNKKKSSISASAKTFKSKTKTKKYTVTLTADKGSSINGKSYMASGKKVTLKVNGKTYSAKTDSKGQVTFSLKLTKKAKYIANIKFAGDNTYSATSKKVTIIIK